MGTFLFLCIYLLLLLLLQVPSLASNDSADQIISCFTLHNINNFTTYPTATTNDHYYQMLNFSIQNLRFADSTIPKPIAIVLPENVDQITNVILCSREASLQIVVRCGGHSYEGTSSVDAALPFLIIDMMNLNRVAVDLQTKTAWVEGGATLGETYHAIAKASGIHGFSAGSCPTVGVGGHIAGGGFGLLSRKYGVAADNVVDALLVDANGKLLDRQGMGEEVFWAIRGGGGGIWGIVYAWKIQLLIVPPRVTSFILSRPGSKRHVAWLVSKWQHVAPHLVDDFYLSCFVGAQLPETTITGISATFKGFYLGPKSNATSILNKVFPELGIVEQDCTESSWIESIIFFSGLRNGSSISDLTNRYLQDKKYFKAKSDFVRCTMPYQGIRALVEILEVEPKGYVILDPYGGFMDRISSDSIAFPHRKGNVYLIQYLVEWREEDNKRRNEYTSWIRGLYKAMTPYVSRGPRAAYINYMDFDLGVMNWLNTSVQTNDAVDNARVWGQKYFLNNFDRLVRAKTLIDPHNVFSNQQGIPPTSLVSLS